ncbi:hypothetical protein Dred_0012 [Desulforamulus reducens MI-1]|uniref:Uncharacterized protein n=1 Tax=Desulforamulus reducens (strain ATCC BAA-1160 / DSM 100696 / MI-1) TaxID=349161 RepID=A4J0G1_DESRM|nr:hypothetical protein [Desulforamulus reducens]ABO48564.1 hypothetical protein Dred_0012 [Desulforamulus reducens MI-1]
MKFVNLNKLGKWVVTLAVIFSFMFGTLLENKLQVMANLQNIVENVNAVALPAGNKIKERFDAYYKEAEKTYEALKIGTAISMAILLSSLPKTTNRGP